MIKLAKLEKFSMAGLKTFLGGSCAYGAYVCTQLSEGGRTDPLVAAIGIGLAATSGVLLKSTAKDIYLQLKSGDES